MYATRTRDGRTIPTPALPLHKFAAGLDEIHMVDRDTKGGIDACLLPNMAAGQNGQVRTSRPVIQLIVEMVAPTPVGVICDPACGTCEAADAYVNRRG
jgi:type I restriction enzyme M protein